MITVSGTAKVVSEPKVHTTRTGWRIFTIRIVLKKKSNNDYVSSFINVKCWTKDPNFKCEKGDQISILNGSLEEEKWIDKTTNQEKTFWSIVTFNCTTMPRLNTPKPSQEQINQADWGDSPFEDTKETTVESEW